MQPGGEGGTIDFVRPTALVVDDHESFRRYVRQLLVAAGYDVVGETDGAGSVVALAEQLRPTLVLLDVVLPDGDGIDIASQLDRLAGTSVLLISSRTLSDFGTALGERPFVNKAELTIECLARMAGHD
jgi:DNA-binding response OmpR family regulator